MKKLFEIGRFTFLIPYILMPFLLMLLFREDFQEAAIFSYCLPFGIESPVVILYPLCWLITIVCIIAVFVLCARSGDKKGILINCIILAVLILFVIVQAIVIVRFVAGFELTF